MQAMKCLTTIMFYDNHFKTQRLSEKLCKETSLEPFEENVYYQIAQYCPIPTKIRNKR